jgi:predicted ABC-type transport system involved in lysophospholipase L1 biosynthesis ATPase subunit
MDDDTLSRVRGQQVGFIFQSYNLIAQLSVIENIQVPLIYQERIRRSVTIIASSWRTWSASGIDSPTGQAHCPAVNSSASAIARLASSTIR